MSTLTAPLDKLLSKEETTWSWDESAQRALELLKEAVSSAPILSFPNFLLPFVLETDASKFAMGATLYQVDQQGKRKYVAFMSKSFNRAQRHYSVNHKELLALVHALEKYRYYLLGRHFLVHTDHRSLIFLFDQVNMKEVLKRYLAIILQFDFSIQHVPGRLNCLPDLLSRILWMSEAFDHYQGQKLGEEKAEKYALVDVNSFVVDELMKHPEDQLRLFVQERLNKKCPREEERHSLLESAHSASGHFGGDIVFQKLFQLG
jgi:hypothetical protein